ncbi:dissimilatory-type sulfite reductase subunit alpha [Pyrobaculum neutrophilum]|uniref:Sulfite reductase, dissimilatory-type alpha subunit n=1 Tax=Pyrobaculum neutrophilum (strain DSM 2338 / JCM 9278 / NBRC 100436 / V24Sta) TaxID=444157 RepID=B1YBR0_PYRNV|nr:dissimilatory-type sulfite reductase subunit alpha [Pyrobaculum neutrophilum]ACB39294.1 sulfite reductase, dissimilatory-type alpha subunit [Pyrobaculum neutrophilum V24Sta]
MAAPPNLPPPDKLLEMAEQYLKELEKGPWPSHVAEIRKTGYPLHVYGVGLVARKSPWGPSAVKAKRLTGVLARIARDWVPKGGEEVHFRVFHTPGRFLPTSYLRGIIKVAREYGIGLVEVVGQTGAMVINVRSKEVGDAMIEALRQVGTDVGGSGDAIRELNTCVGPALCEFALYDTLKWFTEFRKDKKIHDAIAVPGFPYKFKIKFSGCPMDCGRANRADLGFIGTWKGAPEVDQELLRKKIEAGEVDPNDLVSKCAGGAISWDAEKKELKIDGSRCKKCMYCIRKAYPAIKPGKERRVAVVVGGGSKGRYGPKLGWFVGYLKPDEVQKGIELVFKVIEPWDKEAQAKVRVGDYILMTGLYQFIEKTGIQLEDTPKLVEKLPDNVPYRVLPEEERKKYAQFAEELRRAVGI